MREHVQNVNEAAAVGAGKRAYPEVDVEIASIADLEGDVEVVFLVEHLEEASLFLGRYGDAECGDGLDGHQSGDDEEGEFLEHCGVSGGSMVVEYRVKSEKNGALAESCWLERDNGSRRWEIGRNQNRNCYRGGLCAAGFTVLIDH